MSTQKNPRVLYLSGRLIVSYRYSDRVYWEIWAQGKDSPICKLRHVVYEPNSDTDYLQKQMVVDPESGEVLAHLTDGRIYLASGYDNLEEAIEFVASL